MKNRFKFKNDSEIKKLAEFQAFTLEGTERKNYIEGYIKGYKDIQFLFINDFSEEEVRDLIQSIYSEFAELDRSRYFPHELRRIIEIQVEKHPLKPIKIFK
jgi:hypothetical protein